MNKNITNHPSALDINEIWAAIEPQVDIINAQRKKRKPAFIYWFSGLAVLVGLGIAGLFFFDHNFKQQPEISNEPLLEPATHIAAPSISTDNNSTVEKPKTAAINADQKTAPAVITTPTSKAKIEKPTIFENTSIVEKTAEEILSFPSNINSSSLAINNVNTSDLIDENPPISPTTSLQEEIEQASTIPVKEEKIVSVSPLTISNIGLTAPVSGFPKLDLPIKNNKSLVPPPIYIERPTFSIELQAGISAVNRTLNATGITRDGALDTLATIRNMLEEPLEALHANILVNAHFPSGFFLSSGVGFTQINERYLNNTTVEESIVDSMGIQKLIINLAGDTIPVIGPVISTRTTTFTKRFYNSYRMIDIPFFVGYQYDFGDWKTDISLGVFANILLATEGRIPDSPTTDLDLSTDGDLIYRSRIDYSFQFGIGVTKSLTDKLSLRLNPMFRFYSRNFINESVGLNQEYLLFGGTVGLRIDL